MPIDPSSDRPLFRQLADELRSEIRSGKRPAAANFPQRASSRPSMALAGRLSGAPSASLRPKVWW